MPKRNKSTRGRKMRLRQQKQLSKKYNDYNHQDNWILSNGQSDADCKSQDLDPTNVSFDSIEQIEEAEENIVNAIICQSYRTQPVDSDMVRINHIISETEKQLHDATSLDLLINRASTAKNHLEEAIHELVDEKEKEMQVLCKHEQDAQRIMQQMHQQFVSGLHQQNETDSQKLKQVQKEIICYETQMHQIRAKLTDLDAEERRVHNRMDETKQKEEEYAQCHVLRTSEMHDAVKGAAGNIKSAQAEFKSTFESMVRERIEGFERKYDEWSSLSVVSWISKIENDYFSAADGKYDPLFEAIEKWNITGARLQEMDSKLFLNVVGLSEDEQVVLITHIQRVIDAKQKEMAPANVCGVCVRNEINSVMIPCGHQYYCTQCVSEHGSQIPTECPICRTRIRQIIKTFMSGVKN
eukprot:487562_1